MEEQQSTSNQVVLNFTNTLLVLHLKTLELVCPSSKSCCRDCFGYSVTTGSRVIFECSSVP